jgi:DNA-directed RNA polymerase specialized sigma24 family protein
MGILPLRRFFLRIAADQARKAAGGGELTMAHVTVGFTLDTLLRKKFEKLRRKQKDARLHNRLSALLWLGQGRTPDEVADLLGVCPRTVHNWLHLYQRRGLPGLLTLEYQGDPG